MLSRNTSNSELGMEDLCNQNSTGLFIKTANRKKKRSYIAFIELCREK